MRHTIADDVLDRFRVRHLAGCEAAVNTTIKAFGRLDILINNAGVARRLNMADTDERAWEDIMNTNVKGTYFCSRAALPYLTLTKGAIINLASQAGLNGYATLTAYCASKGAIVNLTRAMAIELAPTIRINCVCPGVTDTDMARDLFNDVTAEGDWYPMKRIASPDEIARTILYLASAEAGFITSIALAIDGGATAGG
jgi:NAD(P)-dependent dehydrogenase (short-subunit alcohol dehydrogenase family)